MRWFGHIVRRDEEVEIKSVGAENRRIKKERQASEMLDWHRKEGHEKEGSCATLCRG